MNKKSFLTFFLACFLLFACAVPALSAPTPSPAPTASPAPSEGQANSGGIFLENDALEAPTLKAQSAMLMDLKSGRVIYSKNAKERLYPASTTKIMTAVLALESGKMGETATATLEALAPITNEDSHMGVLLGEELTMEQLVNGMLIYSANDAANVIAIQVAGSLEKFVEMMNAKAQELGAVNTHFVNAYGIHDDDHYTTAEDLAIMAKYAMQNEAFREIVKKPTYTIPATNKYKTDRILPNTNLFLSKARSSFHIYEPAIGIKTGHTSQAGYCLVSAAKVDETELLSVVMKCPDKDTKQNAYSYTDSKALLTFGFNNYKYDTIAANGDVIADSKVFESKNDTRVALTVQDPISALLPSEIKKDTDLEAKVNLPEELRAPIKKGEKLGSVSYSYKGSIIGGGDLVAANDVERDTLLFIFHLVVNILTNPFFFIPAILIIILLFIRRHNKKKQERLRRMRELRSRRMQGTGDLPPRRQSRPDSTKRTNSNSRYKKDE